MVRRALVGLGALMVLGLCMRNVVHAGAEDWNEAQIKWSSYEDALKTAKQNHQPICLIFYTSWCPHCANYSKLFKDPALVEKSKKFVMVRVNSEQNKDLSGKFKPDGEYIPRTFFLSPDGKLDESLTAGRPQFKYFYDEAQTAGILAGMDAALARFQK